ncbi:WD40/YVTN/BNR-like repeat-containing protein [Rugamonas apoptosis]|uniref:Photosystem I reaction center subunit IV n=1 Tax=Rugamonas apoptosis TaxID=2758570 RepID=A0A7W2FBZ4_9BURK|nr:YCF48-related protein [Rugamonas apoptosis]MBA5688911.1 photosystem I reaction center subunit IV [Rugamonas apoptosis]
MIHTTLAKIGSTRRYLLVCIALAAPLLAHAGIDRLDNPAYLAPKASGAMMVDVVRAGNRVVAVGEHGIILYSDTNGKTWRQAAVPVSVTLTAVYFPMPKKGWAVGHDGVILRSEDGGGHWTKQFDGNTANALVLAAARKRERDARDAKHARTASSEEAGGQPVTALQNAERALEDAQAGAKFGPSRPLFDVWFKDESEGIAVGSFGQLFHTADGGRTWALWGERIANPDGLHLNAISATAKGTLLIAGEAGKVFRSADGGASWTTLDTGYAGQLYGVLGIDEGGGRETLIAFGFGGNVFRLTGGSSSWRRVSVEEKKPVVSGRMLADGRIALLTYDGRILLGDERGQSFRPATRDAGMSVAAFTLIDNGAFIVAGEKGIRIVSMNNTIKTRQP